MIRIVVLLALVTSTPVSCATSKTVLPPASTTDSLVLVGARHEIANGTKYNPWLLWNYVTTDYRNGERQTGAVYPGGDIDPNEGVCTDLIVRACRQAGHDLQRMVHEDVSADRDAYGIDTPDKYIDHRRVWVLLKYFTRNFESLSTETGGDYADWLPGDIVIWDVGSNHHMHIGIISDRRTSRSNRPYVVHNNRYLPGVFPGMTAEQDILLGPKLAGIPVATWKIVGHYRLSRPKSDNRDGNGPAASRGVESSTSPRSIVDEDPALETPAASSK